MIPLTCAAQSHASPVQAPSLLCSGQWSKMELVVARLAEALSEVQGGSREPHAPLVALPGERAVQVTVELVGPCSCQFSGLLASHTSALQESRRQAGTSSLEEFRCLLNYLWCCAADGTTALAREYWGLPEVPPFAFDRVQAEKSMITPFWVPSAPMPLPGSLRPRRSKAPGSPVPFRP